MAALQLVSSSVLQNSVTGPEPKKLEKAIDLAYTTLMHVQLCSHAHLIMWLAHYILCKQQLILQLAYMYSVAVLIIPMQLLARSYKMHDFPEASAPVVLFFRNCSKEGEMIFFSKRGQRKGYILVSILQYDFK